MELTAADLFETRQGPVKDFLRAPDSGTATSPE
jgi:hypothetical protein